MRDAQMQTIAADRLQIDIRLLPTLFILLILNYLDRNALA